MKVTLSGCWFVVNIYSNNSTALSPKPF
uniref:Uncharacterized protein n=1 Tax=Arundo donax TaxID=35708 RepID=A0A0A9HHF5_ARUDO